MEMTLKSKIAWGTEDAVAGRKMGMRAAIWFGFAYHVALQSGEKKQLDEVLNTIGETLYSTGAVKSEVSARRKQAKVIGSNFERMFGAELVTQYNTEQDKVLAMFVAAQASGATSIAKLLDLAQHGDAEYTVKKKAAEAEAKAQAEAEAKERAAKEMAEIMANIGEQTELGLGETIAPPVPLAAPVAESGSVAEPEAGAKFEPETLVAGLDDAQLEALIKAVLDEKTARAQVAEAKVA